MARVKRLNRVLTVPDEVVGKYLKEGYDQIDDKGEVIKRATGGRFVSIAEYNKVVEELEKTKAEIKKLKSKKGSK